MPACQVPLALPSKLLTLQPRRLLPLLLVAQLLSCGMPASAGNGAKWTIGEIGDPPEGAQPCPALSQSLITSHAKNKLVLLTAADRLIMGKFGKSWVENTKEAGITYAMVAALDPWTSKLLGHWQFPCFNAPMDRVTVTSDTNYKWGSGHWHETTWNKVKIVAAVHELGFHVIHADTDVTWFQDPMPYFSKHLDGPVHGLFTTDALETHNRADDTGIEAMTSVYVNINTGVYFIRYWEGGKAFFEEWFKLKGVGHDQDGLNALVRGQSWRGDKDMPPPRTFRSADRMIECAYVPGVFVSFLPVSMFGNAYTYVVGQVHKRLNHPLYEVHWVWSGSTMESKQQTIRDAMKFWDPPEYYTTPSLVSFDVWVPEPYQFFNPTAFDDTEMMIQFHVHAANVQLQQLYFGFIAALALDRVLVMPKFQCFCAKNWYMTQSCRINGEPHTQFPYDCALSHLLRVKKLLHGGLSIMDGGTRRTATVREHTFLDNRNVPEEIKKSRLVLKPAPSRRPDLSAPLAPLAPTAMPDGTHYAEIAWPMDAEALRDLMLPLHDKYRVVHFANASRILEQGFRSADTQRTFDETVKKLTTHWCCRSPRDQERFNATDKVNLRILPPERDPTGSIFSAVFGIEPHMGGYNNEKYVSR